MLEFVDVEQRTVSAVDAFGFDPRAQGVGGTGIEFHVGVDAGVVSAAGADFHRGLAGLDVAGAGLDGVLDIRSLGAVGAHLPTGGQLAVVVFKRRVGEQVRAALVADDVGLLGTGGLQRELEPLVLGVGLVLGQHTGGPLVGVRLGELG